MLDDLGLCCPVPFVRDSRAQTRTSLLYNSSVQKKPGVCFFAEHDQQVSVVELQPRKLVTVLGTRGVFEGGQWTIVAMELSASVIVALLRQQLTYLWTVALVMTADVIGISFRSRSFSPRRVVLNLWSRKSGFFL